MISNSSDWQEKLRILSQDSQYDLACSCATGRDEHRRRSKEDKWIYPVALSGGTTFLLKTLISNHCVNDCKYCPLRRASDSRRLSLTPEELSKIFLSYYRLGKVSGLFLSSAVEGSADATMEKINRTAILLRRQQFRGYIHLKIIPAASEAAIRQSLALASAVSLNVETAGEHAFRQLTSTKNYQRDIITPLALISRLIRDKAYLRHLKHTTQFVVGAAAESDKAIIDSTWQMYRQLNLNRVYFSAYQRGPGERALPGEQTLISNQDLLRREHRLYQADWLMRKYGFQAEEIPFDEQGSLDLGVDPKERWAELHPEFFPVKVNKDSSQRLLRVPGLGQVSVERILTARRMGIKIKAFDQLFRQTKLLDRALKYVVFS